MLVARLLGPFGEPSRPAERAPSPGPTPGEPPSPAGAAASAPAAPAQLSAEAPADATTVLRAPDPGKVWRGHAARAVRDVAREHFGRTLDASDEQRLVEALAGVRRAAGEGERDPLDPDDPESRARERERGETIVAGDRAFHEVLGVGVAEFLRLLDPEQIEDLAPTPTPAAG